jgi:hypothetical protein
MIKEIVVFLGAFIIGLCSVALAENEATYDPAAGTLHIPKVIVGILEYQVDMQQMSGLNFTVVNITPASIGAETVPTKNISVDGINDDWSSIDSVISDPTDDAVNMFLIGEDITSISLAQDDSNLYILIKFNSFGSASSSIYYGIGFDNGIGYDEVGSKFVFVNGPANKVSIDERQPNGFHTIVSSGNISYGAGFIEVSVTKSDIISAGNTYKVMAWNDTNINGSEIQIDVTDESSVKF